MVHFLPPGPFRRPLLVRTAAVWTFLRLAAMAGTAMAGQANQGAIVGSIGLALLVDPVVVLVLFIDMKRRGELIYLANLGYSFQRLAVGLIGLCLGFEAALRGVLG